MDETTVADNGTMSDTGSVPESKPSKGKGKVKKVATATKKAAPKKAAAAKA